MIVAPAIPTLVAHAVVVRPFGVLLVLLVLFFAWLAVLGIVGLRANRREDSR